MSTVITLIPVLMHLLQLFVENEPKLEADVKDILAIVAKMRNRVAEDGVK